jgi:hypothetical protein
MCQQFILTFLFFNCVKFSYDTSFGSIYLVLMNNIFLCGLLALLIISFKNKKFPSICLMNFCVLFDL